MKDAFLVATIACGLALFLGGCTEIFSDSGPSINGDPIEIVSRSTVVESGDAGFEIFRIPVLVRTAGGDLLLFCEARKGQSDVGNIDIRLFRSTDGGASWRDEGPLVDHGSDTASDIAAVVDGDRIHLLYQERPGEHGFDDYLKGNATAARGYHIYSDDGGKTWSDPTEITEQVLPASDEQLPMFGPNNGIVLDSGRLVVPMYYANQSADAWTAAVIYSDDGGETWTRSVDAIPGDNVNETALIQGPNGDVYGIARDGSGDQDDQKRFFRSTDGGETWTEIGDVDSVVPEVRCQQSMGARGSRLFLATPQQSGRTDGRLKMGRYDTDQPDNVDWNETDLQITPGGFAYSSMAVHDSTIHLVYEKKTSDGYESLEYVQLALPRTE